MPVRKIKLVDQQIETFKCPKCNMEFQSNRGLLTHSTFAHISKQKRLEFIQKRKDSRAKTIKLRHENHDDHDQNHENITAAEILASLILKRDSLNETIDYIRVMIASR